MLTLNYIENDPSTVYSLTVSLYFHLMIIYIIINHYVIINNTDFLGPENSVFQNFVKNEEKIEIWINKIKIPYIMYNTT